MVCLFIIYTNPDVVGRQPDSRLATSYWISRRKRTDAPISYYPAHYLAMCAFIRTKPKIGGTFSKSLTSYAPTCVCTQVASSSFPVLYFWPAISSVLIPISFRKTNLTKFRRVCFEIKIK